eukprot:TRINITY_DN15290_c0_g1_i1.p1 TRINITY_DN15290_c0_g1~~TRINITY_DN15290_c0_g1_i1.p1  ORF type:complete len:456 (-),score=74.23 TRINITY_DN15290_c0_g1_i1:158-1525(-)
MSYLHRTPAERISGGAITWGVYFKVPYDHSLPYNEFSNSMVVFVREICDARRQRATLPYLLFLQGGPGFPAPRPCGVGGWLRQALTEFRVLLLDQRGTGLSSPVSTESLVRKHGDDAHGMAQDLKKYRADSIVKDCEIIREKLIGTRKWVVLGESFGGFVITHYLSVAPEGLRAALIVGGLPPMNVTIEDVYRATAMRVLQQNREYYERYPHDVTVVREIVSFLTETGGVLLPSGGLLTVERFQMLGIGLGLGSYERLHYMFEGAFISTAGGPFSPAAGDHARFGAGLRGKTLSYNFLREVEKEQYFDTNPLYAILHESIYCETGMASQWAAQRIRNAMGDFDAANTPVLFTGETIFPFMFDQFVNLKPLKEAAHLLAQDRSWPQLYDVARLKANTVPCAAIAFYEDMFVELELSQRTADQIKNLKLWVTSEYPHSGLRVDGERILSRLLNMLEW